jgi:hypothetical protein
MGKFSAKRTVERVCQITKIMNQLPRIVEIIKIEPFKITCRWSTGEARVVDFEPLFDEWKLSESSLEKQLLEYDTFRCVSISEQKTLQWVNILITHKYWDESGVASEQSSPLSYDADNLYARSQPLELYRLVPITPAQQAA